MQKKNHECKKKEEKQVQNFALIKRYIRYTPVLIFFLINFLLLHAQ